ncbi:MAG: SIR2 family NAD-dependent protein deacylase [Balneolaceae bacterium]
MKTLVALTGAGISAESGLATFRGADGLWEGYRIEEVASPEGWHRDKKTVLEFYNKRRTQAAEAKPNPAHKILAELETSFDVQIVTQNVDDLHERAGSANVTHLHGMLRQARSSIDPEQIIDIGSKEIHLGDKAPDGSQLRPNVVWFGEPVPMVEVAADIVSRADILLVIGTSLVVYPAAGLIDFAERGIPKYVIDPVRPDAAAASDWVHISKTAGEGMQQVNQILKKKHTHE